MGGDIDDSSSQPGWYATFIARYKLLDGVSHSSAPHLLYSARAQLADDRALLMTALATILNHQNALAPIHRLPPECLFEIFSHCSDIDLPDPFMGCLGWLVVTHVCRHWRHTALDHLVLWARDVCHPASWTVRNLERSKQAPLTVNIGHDNDDITEHSLRLVLRQMKQVRHLKLEAKVDEQMGNGWMANLVDWDEFGQAAPRLESFAVDMGKWYKLPDNLFQHHAPRLNTLSLTNIPPPLFPWLYANITRANFSYSARQGNVFLSRNGLLDVLEAMPKVQRLILGSVLTTVNQNIQRTVSLPALLFFHLSGRIENNVWLFYHLVLPSSFHLQTVSYADDEDDVVSYEPFFPRIMHPRDVSPSKPRALILITRRAQILLQASLSPNSRVFRFQDVPIVHGTFGAKDLRDLPRFVPHLPMWFELFALDEITSVHLTHADTRSLPPGFFDAFRRLPSVEDVTIEHAYTIVHLLNAFVMDHRADTLPDRPVLFPRLRCFTIDGVDFTHRPLNMDPSVHPYVVLQIVYKLLRLLASRPSHGGALERVRIEQCRIPTAWVEELRAAVPGILVEWDGAQQGCPMIRSELQV